MLVPVRADTELRHAAAAMSASEQRRLQVTLVPGRGGAHRCAVLSRRTEPRVVRDQGPRALDAIRYTQSARRGTAATPSTRSRACRALNATTRTSSGTSPAPSALLRRTSRSPPLSGLSHVRPPAFECYHATGALPRAECLAENAAHVEGSLTRLDLDPAATTARATSASSATRAPSAARARLGPTRTSSGPSTARGVRTPTWGRVRAART
eukprot:1414263-Rhodomonas_salina.1